MKLRQTDDSPNERRAAVPLVAGCRANPPPVTVAFEGSYREELMCGSEGESGLPRRKRAPQMEAPIATGGFPRDETTSGRVGVSGPFAVHSLGWRTERGSTARA